MRRRLLRERRPGMQRRGCGAQKGHCAAGVTCNSRELNLPSAARPSGTGEGDSKKLVGAQHRRPSRQRARGQGCGAILKATERRQHAAGKCCGNRKSVLVQVEFHGLRDGVFEPATKPAPGPLAILKRAGAPGANDNDRAWRFISFSRWLVRRLLNAAGRNFATSAAGRPDERRTSPINERHASSASRGIQPQILSKNLCSTE